MTIRKTLHFMVCTSFLFSQMALAQKPPEIDLQDLAMPSEIKDLAKQAGAVYYSSTSRNKSLMPVHFWGEVQRPGLHYIPVDTKLIKGLSFAGGGGSLADLDEVVVNRVQSGKIKRSEFDLDDGGDIVSHEYTLHPGDTVFVPRDMFQENRAFYTSLISVAATIISTILIVKRIEKE